MSVRQIHQQFIDACKSGNVSDAAAIMADNLTTKRVWSELCQTALSLVCMQKQPSSACVDGNAQMIQWLTDRVSRIDQDDIDDCVFELVSTAPMDGDHNPEIDHGELFLSACRDGVLVRVKAVWQMMSAIDGLFLSPYYELSYFDQSFRAAGASGHLEVVKWIHEIHPEIALRNHATLTSVFKQACGNGHLNIISWITAIAANGDSPIDVRDDSDIAFRLACLNGHLAVAKWLWAQQPDIHARVHDDYPFRIACANGHLCVAQWLVQTFPEIDIRTQSDYPFRFACGNGHLATAMWLRIREPTINVCEFNNWALNQACFSGHLEVVQWLVRICPGIDVRADSDYASRVARLNGHDDVLHWLDELIRPPVDESQVAKLASQSVRLAYLCKQYYNTIVVPTPVRARFNAVHPIEDTIEDLYE